MKILFPLKTFYPSQTGGPANTVYWHVKALSQKGAECTVITSDTGIADKKIKRGVFLNFDFGKVYYGTSSFLKIKTIYRCLCEVGKNDIIHTNSLFEPISMITVFFTKLFYPKKLIICSVRGELNEEALKFSSWKKTPFLYLYFKKMSGLYFHSTSEKEMGEISKYVNNSKNCFLIPNLIYQVNQKKEVKVKSQFLFLGRIHPIKSIESLVESVSCSTLFRKESFYLLIAGSYESRHKKYFNFLKSLVKKYDLNDVVHFTGHVEGSQKEKLLRESYALILPSKTENFGNVVLESLINSTPVIASTGTPWKILEEYQAGLHVSNKPKHLSQAIDKFIDMDADDYLEYRKNSLKLVKKQFIASSKIDEWVNLYSKLLKVDEKI